MNKLIELMDKYMDLEKQKTGIMQKVSDNDGGINWNDIRPGLDRVGLREAHTKIEEAQHSLLGKAGPYYADFGGDETPCVFEWLRELMKEDALMNSNEKKQ